MIIPLPPNTSDESGHRYADLTVIEYAGVAHRHALWRCRCRCGAQIVVPGHKLRQGRVVSCGCWRANPEVRRTARLKVPASVRRRIAQAGNAARIKGRK